MTDEFAKLLRDAHERLSAEQPVMEWLLTPEIDLQVKKFQAFVPVTCCLMTDSTGVNHCDHPTPVRPVVPRLTRLRWRVRARWSSLRLSVGSWIAGRDLDEWGEDE